MKSEFIVENKKRNSKMQKSVSHAEKKWSGKTQGWGTGIKIFLVLIKTFGYFPAYLLLIFVCAVYTAGNKSARAAIKDFRLRLGLKTCVWDYYAHFFSFSVSLIHRIGLLVRKKNELKYSTANENYIEDEIAGGRGVILLSSHIGNWEIAGEILSGRLKAKINVLMVERDGEQMKKIYESVNKNRAVNIISIGENPFETMIAVKTALENGEIVAALGDRYIDENIAEVEFLGAKAKFPRGIFEIACITNTKIIPVFMTRKKLHFYEFRAGEAIVIARFDKLSNRIQRKENIDRAVQDFANQIAGQARITPLQWYNFYKFWG